MIPAWRVRFSTMTAKLHPHPVNRVRMHRERRRLTLEKLALIIGSTKTHISLIERGIVKPYGIMQERLAEGLGVPRAELFPPVDEPAESEAAS